MKKYNREKIETVGELIELLKQYPVDYEIRIFATYDGGYLEGGHINKIEINGETVDLFNE